MGDDQCNVFGINRPTTGVHSISRPGRWVVPPWPNNAGVHEIVRQFVRFNPLYRCVEEADEKAYYLGYQQALDTASTHDLTCDLAWRWYGELRHCVARCAAYYDRSETRVAPTQQAS